MIFTFLSTDFILSHPAPVEDIFILDTYTQLFLWIGEGSTEDEKMKGDRFAKQFIAEVRSP